MGQFDKHRVKRWRRETWRIFEQQGFKPAEIMAALVMAAVSGFGTDVDVLSELTGSSTDYVTKVLRRLRKQRVLAAQTMRTRWTDDNDGYVATLLDAGVAAGLFTRDAVDQRRSAAQKARAPETRHVGPQRQRVRIPKGAVFTPKTQKANPMYGLPGWTTPNGTPASDAIGQSATDTAGDSIRAPESSSSS